MARRERSPLPGSCPRLSSTGELPPPVEEPARALSDSGLRNLIAFTKLFGIVRHFHPSDEAAAADWNRFAIEGVRKIEGAASPAQLAGGYSVTWTGMKVLKQDGSRRHGVGIRPTVPASPTQAGVAAGRDEVLERGVALLKRP